MTRITVKATFGLEGETALQRCRLTVEPETTVEALKTEVLRSFSWETGLNSAEIVLSLNKRDPLGEDSARVLDCGVCSGDILWVLPPEGHPSIKCLPNKQQKPSSTVNEPSTSSDPLSVTQDDSPTEDNSIYELPVQAVCSFLRQACMQSGLETVEPMGTQPASQAMHQSIYALTEALLHPQADSPAEDKAQLQFECFQLGMNVMICSVVRQEGKEENSFGCSLHIPIETFFQQSPAGWAVVREKELVTKLKTLMCAPTMSKAADALGRLLRWTFTALPEEVILAILSEADFKSVISLSMTCRYLHTIAASDALWKHLYNKTFDGAIEEWRLEGRNEKERFRRQWERQKRTRSFDMPFTRERPPQYWYPPLHPGAHGFPGIIGGDADRFPFPQHHPGGQPFPGIMGEDMHRFFPGQPRHQDIPSLFGPRRPRDSPFRFS